MYLPRIAILISGTGTNMEAILKASITGELPAQVSFVGSDRLEAEEDELIQGFQDAGMQVDILTEEQLQAFKDAVSDVTAELKAQYGEAACAAFGIE